MTDEQIKFICRTLTKKFSYDYVFSFDVDREKGIIVGKITNRKMKFKTESFEMKISTFLEDIDNSEDREKTILEIIVEDNIDFLNRTPGFSFHLTLAQRIAHLCSKNAGPCKFAENSVFERLQSLEMRGAIFCPFADKSCSDITPDIVKNWLMKELER